MNIQLFLIENCNIIGRAQAKRLIVQEAVKVNSEVVTDISLDIKKPCNVKAGSKLFDL